jgi:hypothetical protein
MGDAIAGREGGNRADGKRIEGDRSLKPPSKYDKEKWGIHRL